MVEKLDERRKAPAGWEPVLLDHLLLGIEAGKSFTCEPRPASKEEWGVIKVSAMTWGVFDETENKAVPKRKSFDAKNQINEGDILLSRSNTADLVGATVLVGQCRPRLLLSDKSMRLIYPHCLSPRWLQKSLAAPQVRSQISAMANGTSDSMRNISQRNVRAINLLLPPRSEQERIADALDELLSDLDAGVVALQRARAKLALYRASVLKAAVQGTLTAEWRKQHPKAEPASVLLQRILAERRQRWEQEQLHKFKSTGRTPPANWKSKYKEPVAPNTTNLPELPEGWSWASFDQVSDIQGGLQKTPERAPAKNHYPYLRVANVLRGALDLRDLHRFELTGGELDRLRLRQGDLLIVEGNGSRSEIGRCALWTGEVADCVHQNHIIRLRPLFGLHSEYLNLYLNSPIGQSVIQLVASSTSGLYTLSVGKIQKLPVALAPSGEQELISEIVAELLSVIEHVQADLDGKAKSVHGLRQSILCHAFTGQLVPQDPNDEPASELLKRIAAERETRKKSTAIRRKQTAKRQKREK